MVEQARDPLDPSPEEWLTDERLKRLDSCLKNTVSLLQLSGLLTKALDYWVRLELAQEMVSLGHWAELERQTEIDALEQVWKSKHDLRKLGLTDILLREKLMVAPGSQRWARQHWKKRLETLYLRRKQHLDQASCWLMCLSNKDLAMELFHRIRAGESSFENLALKYSEGKERLQGGYISLRPLTRMPHGLGSMLKNMQSGELMPPQRLAEGFLLVQLERYEPALLDASTEEVLLSQELQLWVKHVVSRLVVHLTSLT